MLVYQELRQLAAQQRRPHHRQRGGLINLGTTTLTDCTISGNSALASGGLNNTGTLTLTNCTVSGNSSTSTAPGGGLANLAGTLTLTD